MATLMAVVGWGQEVLSEVSPYPRAPVEFAPPTFGPPPSAAVEDTPLEIAPVLPEKYDLSAARIEGFGMGGRGMGAGMGGPGIGGPGYGASWYPARPVSGSTPETELGLVRQNLSGAVPVCRDGGELVMLSGGVRNSRFITDTILPDSRQLFPSELWSVHLGLNYMHRFDNGWTGGLGISLGSATSPSRAST